MTNFSRPIYLCSECKKIMDHLDDLLFIDEYSHKGFCCEECIEDFYFPLIKHFEMVEHSLRRKHDLVNEIPINSIIGADLIDATLINPNEVFRLTNELNETFYHFIKHFSDFSIVIISSVYQKEASFVFLVTKTKSQGLITEFRYGEMINNWETKDDTDEDDDEIVVELEANEEFSEDFKVEDDEDDDEDVIFIQLLENKKSNILADVLMKRKDNDIPFEDYTGYEFCFQETLDFPDEVFEKKDKEGDLVFTYIKSFSRAQETFYYIVICLKRITKDENVNVYPILAIPTFDMELCQEFREGTRLSGPLRN